MNHIAFLAEWIVDHLVETLTLIAIIVLIYSLAIVQLAVMIGLCEHPHSVAEKGGNSSSVRSTAEGSDMFTLAEATCALSLADALVDIHGVDTATRIAKLVATILGTTSTEWNDLTTYSTKSSTTPRDL